MSMIKGSTTYRIQVIDRAVQILDLFTEHGPELTLQELALRSGLHKSTVHRILMVLEHYNIVQRGPGMDGFRLGPKLFELGMQVASYNDLRERSRPYLKRLMLETDETAHLCVLDGFEVLYLDKVEPSRSIRMTSNVGRRNPAYCTAVGKALLAFLPEEELDNVINKLDLRAFTEKTITTAAQLRNEFELVRKLGYALDNEEHEEGLKCIGAPVRDYSNSVVASISIAGPAFRLTDQRIAAIAKTVKEVTKVLSAELGYKSQNQTASAVKNTL